MPHVLLGLPAEINRRSYLLWAFRAGRFGWLFAWAVVVLSFREDLALAVAPLGLVAFWRGAPRWVGIGLIALVIGYFVLATQLVLPLIVAQDYGQTIVANNLGADWLSAALDTNHWLALLALLSPVLLLPLAAPESLIGGASVAAILIFDGGISGNLLHFIAPAVAASVGGAVIASVRRPWAERAAWTSLAATLLIHLTPTGLAIVATECAHNGPPADDWMCQVSSPFDPALRERGPAEAARDEGVTLVPPEARVTASGHLLPKLSPRATLWEYGHDDAPFGEADWIVLDAADRYAGAGRYLATGPVAPHVEALQAAGFELVFQSSDGAVATLRRHGPSPADLSARLRLLMPKRGESAGRRGTRSPGAESRERQEGLGR